MDKGKILKSNQEQAVASWIAYLNQVRINNLSLNMQQENMNLQKAMEALEGSLDEIRSQIISTNRGGTSGMHGFIAEVAETGFANAEQLIKGKDGACTWVNNNGPVDLITEGVNVQQKFYNSGGPLSLNAIKEHLSRYPDFLSNGGKYQIPKDQFEKMGKYLSMSAKEASRLSKNSGDLSYGEWKKVNDFFSENKEISFKDIEGSKLEYREVQVGAIDDTYEREKLGLEKINEERKDSLVEKYSPSFDEAMGIAAKSAAIEGGVSIAKAVMDKRKEGKNISSFDSQDWIDVLGSGAKGSVKGGIRGVSIYSLTNFTGTPAYVASSLTTASLAAAEMVHRYRLGEINEAELAANIEAVCIESSVSAVSSLIGSTVIPIPVIGAVIGNTIGTTMYSVIKDYKEDERKLLERYVQESVILDRRLDDEYREYIDRLSKSMEVYIELIGEAFNPDPVRAFEGSIELAKQVGVNDEDLLKTEEEIDDFFLN